jgi:transcriptional regulator with XRE-family HTH domain
MNLRFEARQEVAERLRGMRSFKRLSQKDAARKVGLSRAALSAIETGKRGVDSLELLALARLYGYPTAFFLGEAPEYGGIAGAIAQLIGDLGEEERAELLRYADYLRSRRERATLVAG